MTEPMKPLHLPVTKGNAPEETGRYLIWYTHNGKPQNPFIGDYDLLDARWIGLGLANEVIAFAGPLPLDVPEALTADATYLNWTPETGLQAGFEGGAVRILAEEFAKNFDQSGAKNYLTMDFREPNPPNRMFKVTIQRADGETPTQRLAQAYAALRQCDDVLTGDDPSTAGIAEALAAVRAVLSKGNATTQPQKPAARGNAVEVGTISTADADGDTHEYKCAMLIEFPGIDECKRALESGRIEFTVFGEAP